MEHLEERISRRRRYRVVSDRGAAAAAASSWLAAWPVDQEEIIEREKRQQFDSAIELEDR